MKFKEFAKWCNERACDGCWGMLEAMACIDLNIAPVGTIHQYIENQGEKDKPGSKNKDLSQ